MALSSLLDAVAAIVNEGRGLGEDEAREAMRLMLAGSATEVEIAAFLVALRMKGETAIELAGFARAMRDAAEPLNLAVKGEPLLDTCGTGGKDCGTFNISTLAALVVAGAGVRVAKHGNRSISSRCGSADVLEALGVRIELSLEQAAGVMRAAGIAFLFAPAFHRAMRHVQPVRRELKLRTTFNLLGPLTNPAGASVQVVGAASRRAAELIAEALVRLGLERGYVVHGSDGLDEVTTTGPTLVFEIANGAMREFTVAPEDFGVERVALQDLAGGDVARNAEIARAVLAGAKGPARDIVLVNASMGLMAAGKAPDLRAAMRLAAESIDAGCAQSKLDSLVRAASRI